jgi:AraC-like DNA-binding protein
VELNQMVWLDEGGLGRGAARLIAAPASLAPFVEHFWIQAVREPRAEPWRIVPDASAHLILAVESKAGGGERARCCVVGSRTTYEDIQVSRRVLTIGARLRPGALPQLTQSDAWVFADRAFRAEDVFGPAGRRLAGRMSENTPEIAVDHLKSFLEERFAKCEPDFQLDTAIRSTRSVASMAQAMGLSVRGIWNSAMDRTGLAPRRLLRILRLHRALHRAAIPGAKWSEIAYLSGYADQAHLIREFVALLGKSPNAWRKGARADSFNTTPRSALQS